jgi:hypothetical protein
VKQEFSGRHCDVSLFLGFVYCLSKISEETQRKTEIPIPIEKKNTYVWKCRFGERNKEKGKKEK